MKIGDKKERIKFALFPIKMSNKLKGNKFIWLKTYKDTYEYQQLKQREIQPVENIVSEDGRPFYHPAFSKYEWVKYEKWVRIKREVVN